MKPLRRYLVTAKMLGGHVLDSELYLESIMAATHPAMHSLPSKLIRQGLDKAVQAPLPLAAVWSNGHSNSRIVWLASAGYYPEDTRLEKTHFVKRRDGIDVMMTQRTFQPGSGAMKDRMEMRALIMAREIRWYIACNEPNEIKRLLRRNCQHIGSVRRMGYGEVREWEIEEVDDKIMDCLVSGIKAMRRLPVSILEQFDNPEQMTVRPPYWYMAERCLGVNTGSRCALKDGLRVAV